MTYTATISDISDAPFISLHADDIPWQTLTIPPNLQGARMSSEPSKVALVDGIEGSGGLMVRLIDYKSGVKGTPHMHATAERTFVLSGAVGVVIGDIDERDAVIYEAGSYFTIPANTRHYAMIPEAAKVLTLQLGDYKAILIDR